MRRPNAVIALQFLLQSPKNVVEIDDYRVCYGVSGFSILGTQEIGACCTPDRHGFHGGGCGQGWGQLPVSDTHPHRPAATHDIAIDPGNWLTLERFVGWAEAQTDEVVAEWAIALTLQETLQKTRPSRATRLQEQERTWTQDDFTGREWIDIDEFLDFVAQFTDSSVKISSTVEAVERTFTGTIAAVERDSDGSTDHILVRGKSGGWISVGRQDFKLVEL